MPAVVALRGTARDIKNILRYDRRGNYSTISTAFDHVIEKLGRTRLRELKRDPTRQAEVILERLSSREYNRDHRFFNRTCLRGKFSNLVELASYVSDRLEFPRGYRDLALYVAVIVACEDSVQYLDVNLGLVAGRAGILKEILFDDDRRVKKFHDPTYIAGEFKKYLREVVTTKKRPADDHDTRPPSRAVQLRLKAPGAAPGPPLLTSLVDEDVKRDTIRIRDSLARGNHMKVVEYLDMWFTLVCPPEQDQKDILEYMTSEGIPMEGTTPIARMRSTLLSMPVVVKRLREREAVVGEQKAVVEKFMSMKIPDSPLKDAVWQIIQDKTNAAGNAGDAVENIFESLSENSGMTQEQALRTMSLAEIKARFKKEFVDNCVWYVLADLECLATAEFAKKYSEMKRDNPAASGEGSRGESSSDSDSYSDSE